MSLQIKRVYDKPSRSDGYRVLVDRFYPRGLTKREAAYKVWLKDIAPSRDLVKWYHEDSERRWPEFKKRYKEELRTRNGKEEVENLLDIIEEHPKVTLLYGSKDEEHNNAVVLEDILLRKL